MLLKLFNTFFVPGSLANSVDPDEMRYSIRVYTDFVRVLMYYILENTASDPLKCILTYPTLIVFIWKSKTS